MHEAANTLNAIERENKNNKITIELVFKLGSLDMIDFKMVLNLIIIIIFRFELWPVRS